MKWTLIFSITWLLQACDSFDTRPINIQTFDKVPEQWQVNGRIGAVFGDKHQNADFEVNFDQQNYKLILANTFGLGQMIIESTEQGLSVDEKPVIMSFKQWMIAQTTWYFPIHELGKIVFNQPFINKDWQLKVLARYPNQLPKTIRLIHQNQDISIKLILKDVRIK